MLHPQAFGAWRTFDGATCAFGAAGEAAGLLVDDVINDPFALAAALTAEWPWLEGRSRCPVCGAHRICGRIIADCLNDRHRWTREQIADWVETIERREPVRSADAEDWRTLDPPFVPLREQELSSSS
jgi:hypothetical protein